MTSGSADLGMFTTVNARKQRTSRCLGLACDKQVKIANCQAERASRKLPQYEPALRGSAQSATARTSRWELPASPIGVPAGFEPLAGSPMRFV